MHQKKIRTKKTVVKKIRTNKSVAKNTCCCGKHFKSKKALTGHQCGTLWATMRLKKKYAANICGCCQKTFIDENAFQLHLANAVSTTTVSNIRCATCGRHAQRNGHR